MRCVINSGDVTSDNRVANLVVQIGKVVDRTRIGAIVDVEEVGDVIDSIVSYIAFRSVLSAAISPPISSLSLTVGLP